MDESTGRYRKGAIQEPLRAALVRIPGLPAGKRDLELPEGGPVITVPDFAWRDAKLAVYCDGYAYHGDRDTLELDARKRNLLQGMGWIVLVFWGRVILRDPDACAGQVAEVYAKRPTCGGGTKRSARASAARRAPSSVKWTSS